jgi:hypothetical protein
MSYQSARHTGEQKDAADAINLEKNEPKEFETNRRHISL